MTSASAQTRLARRGPQNEVVDGVTTGTQRPWSRGLTVWTQTPSLLKNSEDLTKLFCRNRDYCNRN